jgi:hypothetical protein
MFAISTNKVACGRDGKYVLVCPTLRFHPSGFGDGPLSVRRPAILPSLELRLCFLIDLFPLV